MIAAGADVNKTENLGKTPLYEATIAGHETIVGRLIAAGAAVNQANSSGDTPLLLAALQGHEAIVGRLIDAGAAVNQADVDGDTPLSFAALKGHEAIVGGLLDAGADVNKANKNGQTPLYRAAEIGHKGIVEILLAAGADVNAADKSGQTPLYWAVQAQNNNIVALLIEKGADFLSQLEQWKYSDILKVAVRKGYSEAVRQLINVGADPNAAVSLLEIAAEAGHEAVVVQLLKAPGAFVDPVDFWNNTPLHFAVKKGHKAVVARLIAAGADVNKADHHGKTPLSMAIEKKNATTILLLAHHAFKALIKHEAAHPPEAGGAQAAGAQSEQTKSHQLKVQLEALLTEPSDLFTESQATLLRWIIGKHVGFQGGVTEKDLIKNIHLNDLKSIMLPEKDLAALSITSRTASIHHDLPPELQQHMKSYVTQDPLLQELKEKIEQREEVATTIEMGRRGNQACSRPASTTNSAGAVATGSGSGPGSGSRSRSRS